MTTKETLEKAYGSIPKEVSYNVGLYWYPSFRGLKYYLLKAVRKFKKFIA
jgi:hypothetical protein